MLLLTWNENFKLWGLPSFNANHKPLGFPFSGIESTMSGLPGERIERLRNFTSGSSVSAIMKRKTRLFRGLNKKRKGKEFCSKFFIIFVGT
jgi:hypothetical protein